MTEHRRIKLVVEVRTDHHVRDLLDHVKQALDGAPGFDLVHVKEHVESVAPVKYPTRKEKETHGKGDKGNE